MIRIIQENGKFNLTKDMVGEFNYGKINQNIQGNGKMINLMDLVNLNHHMEIIIQENGQMEKQMEKENLLIVMVLFMKENGKMTNKMEKDGKLGLMDQNTLAHILMGLKMDLENLNGEEGIFILEILLIMKCVEKANIFLKTKEFMKECGKKIK